MWRPGGGRLHQDVRGLLHFQCDDAKCCFKIKMLWRASYLILLVFSKSSFGLLGQLYVVIWTNALCNLDRYYSMSIVHGISEVVSSMPTTLKNDEHL